MESFPREMFSSSKPIVKLTVFAKFPVLSIVLIVQILLYGQKSAVSGTNQNSSQLTSRNKTSILKLCQTNVLPGDSANNGVVEIPTFLTDRFSYELEKYQINQNNLMTKCPDGESPVLHPEPTVSKTDFDQEYNESSFDERLLFELLRSAHFLYDNGYLSVGNHSVQEAMFYSPDEFCINAVQGKEIHTTVEFKTCPFSKTRPALRKCCPMGMMLNEVTCVPNNSTEKWDPRYMDAKTSKFLTLDKAQPAYTSPLLFCESDFRVIWEADGCTYEFHPVTDNTVAFMGASRSWEFVNSSVGWCIDTMDADGRQRMVMIHCAGNILVKVKEEDEEKQQARISLLYMVSMYIGTIFHFLTTLVYLMTWPKQNIHGKTLCSCTGSLFFMQIFLGTAHLLRTISNQGKTRFCIVNSIGGQYFMIASFTWLLIVNYDLWRTFRSIRADGNKSGKRFLAFSAFGWLFPLPVSIISITVDFSFPCRVSRVPVPEFGEYYCFVAPWAQGYYVYYILSVLITLVFVLAVLTLYGLYTLRSNYRAADQRNVVLFLKLSVLMGLTWVFEVIGWAAKDENENNVGWIALDLYNALSAILIFLFFVCKRTTLNMLEQSFPVLKGITAALSTLSSIFSGIIRSADKTASTGVDGTNSTVHKNPIDSQATPSVSYTKRIAEQENGTVVE